MVGLCDLEAFTGLDEAFTKQVDLLVEFCNTVDPYTQPLPEPYQSSLSDFQRLLLLRCLRADKLTGALSVFVEKYQGKQFIESPPFSLSQTYADSNNTTPHHLHPLTRC